MGAPRFQTARHGRTGEGYPVVNGRGSSVYRRIFSRFEKLDAMFMGLLNFVLVADGLRGLC